MSPKTAIVAAAVAWWRVLRPMGWTEAKHLEFPTEGTVGVYERNLAIAVAKHLREGGK